MTEIPEGKGTGAEMIDKEMIGRGMIVKETVKEAVKEIFEICLLKKENGS